MWTTVRKRKHPLQERVSGVPPCRDVTWMRNWRGGMSPPIRLQRTAVCLQFRREGFHRRLIPMIAACVLLARTETRPVIATRDMLATSFTTEVLVM